MKVLHFYKTAFPDSMGGVEQVIRQLGRGAAKRGVEVDVLSLSRERSADLTEIDGYRTHRIPLDLEIASTGFSVAAFRRFAALARDADVVHYHFPWPFMDAVHFVTRVKKPTVVTYHSDIVRQRTLLKLYRPLMMRFLASVDRIVPTSPNYCESSEVLRRFGDKLHVIPIGLERASYPPVSSERLEYWRARVGSKFFLFVGMLRYYKGLHILLEALRGTDLPVVIVGAGPIEGELKAQAERDGLRSVCFLGQLPDDDKVALLTLSYGIVFPSHLRSEAFGVSLLEGAMYGKPLISSEIGTGTSYINIHGQTGLVVPPCNSHGLRRAMLCLWDHPRLAERMGRNAALRYVSHFTSDQMLDSYLRLYTELTVDRRCVGSVRHPDSALMADQASTRFTSGSDEIRLRDAA